MAVIRWAGFAGENRAIHPRLLAENLGTLSQNQKPGRGDLRTRVYGSIALPPNDPSAPDFVPYEQITKDLAIGWAKDSMGAEQVAAHECALQSQIDTQKAPVIA